MLCSGLALKPESVYTDYVTSNLHMHAKDREHAIVKNIFMLAINIKEI